MDLRRDHLAGSAFIVAGGAVYALSGDLPFGTLASPGAGMLPKLAIGIMTALGLLLLVRAGTSPPVASISWNDLPHALRVMLIAVIAAWLYTLLGFVLTIALLLFGLTFAVERKPLIPAAAFSIGVTLVAYALFGTLLKSPLPRGLLGF